MKVDKGTLIRTIILFVAMVNGILAMFGSALLPVEDGEIENAVDSVYAAISAVALIVASVVTWWKNNSFTRAAKEGDKRMRELKKKNK